VSPDCVGTETTVAVSVTTVDQYCWRVNETLPLCPECSSDLAYEMGALLMCPICGHEWSAESVDQVDAALDETVVTDAFGTVLADGDSVTVLKSLKVKGSSTVIKVGTKVRGIRLVNGVGDHDIDCRIDGVGSMQLKSSVVKKA
jgi:protein PhnA